MSYRAYWALFLGMALLPACSQLQQTGRSLLNDNGVLQDSETSYLGNRRYRLRVHGSTVFFNGQAERLFPTRAQQVSDSMGCKGWKLHDFKGGTENTLLGARQYAEGVIECL